MTSARVQPFCRKYKVNIGYYDGIRVCPTKFTARNIAIKIQINHFCLIWKSIAISFTKAIEGLKTNFKVVDDVISDKHVKSFIKHEYKPRKVQSPLTNMIVFYLETLTLIELSLMLTVYINLVKVQVNIIKI